MVKIDESTKQDLIDKVKRFLLEKQGVSIPEAYMLLTAVNTDLLDEFVNAETNEEEDDDFDDFEEEPEEEDDDAEEEIIDSEPEFDDEELGVLEPRKEKYVEPDEETNPPQPRVVPALPDDVEVQEQPKQPQKHTEAMKSLLKKPKVALKPKRAYFGKKPDEPTADKNPGRREINIDEGDY